MEQERYAHIQLALTPYIGPESFAELIQHYGSATQALKAPASAIAQLGAHGKKASAQWHNTKHTQSITEAALTWEQQSGCRILLSTDKDFPKMLSEGITAPPILFARGDTSLLQQIAIGIVGSRHATPQAIRITQEFAEALSEQGITVISGMASGIDTAAHLGAINQKGKTIAIWGTGIDRIYPPSNQQLAYEIAEKGLILSEFPLGTRPIAGNFPRRNRLIAAQSHAILVIEAALQSGSLITAHQALEMGREVMAIPSSIDNPNSKGCHQLIKSGAKLVECLEDILVECPIFQAASKRNSQKISSPNTLDNSTNHKLSTKLSTDKTYPNHTQNNKLLPPSETEHQYANLLKNIGYSPIHPDDIINTTNMSSLELQAALTELELEGLIAAMPGGKYQRIS